MIFIDHNFVFKYTQKHVVNCVELMVNELQLLVIFINDPSNIINQICRLCSPSELFSNFDVKCVKNEDGYKK
jgi:hypothetical protein